LTDGCGTIEALRARLYPHAEGVIARVAGRQLEAHLLKLRAEGRVTLTEGRGWGLQPDPPGELRCV
jgi:hypothetical protein